MYLSQVYLVNRVVTVLENPGKSWKVLELGEKISRPWKVLEFESWSLKILEYIGKKIFPYFQK